MGPSPLASPPGYYHAQGSVGAPTVDDPSGRFSGISQAGAAPGAYSVHCSQQPLHARPDGQYAGASPNPNQGPQPPLRFDVPYDPKMLLGCLGSERVLPQQAAIRSRGGVRQIVDGLRALALWAGNPPVTG